MAYEFMNFVAVGSFSKILQLSISHHSYNDPYGILRDGILFPCSCIQGLTFYIDSASFYSVHIFHFIPSLVVG